MISASKLTLMFGVLASTLSSTGATPIDGRAATCKPNFQGRALTIYKQPPITDIGVYEWRATNAVGSHITLVTTPVNTAFASGEFFVGFTGQPTNTYHITLAADTTRQLTLAAGSGGDLAFAVASGSTIPSQEFAIDCTTCPDLGSADGNTVAKNCVISNPATGTCVTGDQNGQTLRLAKCDGTSAQTYTIWQGL